MCLSCAPAAAPHGATGAVWRDTVNDAAAARHCRRRRRLPPAAAAARRGRPRRKAPALDLPAGRSATRRHRRGVARYCQRCSCYPALPAPPASSTSCCCSPAWAATPPAPALGLPAGRSATRRHRRGAARYCQRYSCCPALPAPPASSMRFIIYQNIFLLCSIIFQMKFLSLFNNFLASAHKTNR